MSYLGFLGIAMVVSLLVLLLRGKMTPAIPFALVPLVFAAFASFSGDFGLLEIPGFAASGVSKVATVAILFIGTILFFNIMGDAGMFDPMVNRLVRFADKGVTSIFLATSVIVMLTHLDGAGTSLLFLIGTAIALLVNYRNIKEQNERIKAHASQAMAMVIVVISSGVFLGIFTETGMVDTMVVFLINIILDFLAPVLHIVIGFFAAPLGMFIGADPYTYGMLPIILGVTGNIGIDPQSVAIAVVIGECAGWTISPAVSTVYLGIGLIECELKDWLKYAVPIVWAFTAALLVFAIITGCIAI